jgi:hypothetical protein
MEAAKQRDISNIKNWGNESRYIVKGEMEYLSAPADLMAVSALIIDKALGQLQEPIEDVAKWLLTRINSLDKLVSCINQVQTPSLTKLECPSKSIQRSSDLHFTRWMGKWHWKINDGMLPRAYDSCPCDSY